MPRNKKPMDVQAVAVGYVVISNQWGPVFMSESLETAGARLAELAHKQAKQTALVNPSSYRIAEVEMG